MSNTGNPADIMLKNAQNFRDEARTQAAEARTELRRLESLEELYAYFADVAASTDPGWTLRRTDIPNADCIRLRKHAVMQALLFEIVQFRGRRP